MAFFGFGKKKTEEGSVEVKEIKNIESYDRRERFKQAYNTAKEGARQAGRGLYIMGKSAAKGADKASNFLKKYDSPPKKNKRKEKGINLGGMNVRLGNYDSPKNYDNFDYGSDYFFGGGRRATPEKKKEPTDSKKVYIYVR